MHSQPSEQQILLSHVTELTITRPDDWHAHLRDGAALEHTCADLARYFGRVIVMPNLSPPVTTVAEARRLPGPHPGGDGAPAASLRAADDTLPHRPDRPLRRSDSLRPRSLSMRSSCTPPGPRPTRRRVWHSWKGYIDTLAAMEEVDLPLLIHGEVTDHDIDIFDREKVFIDRHLAPIARRFPRLRIVLEHITTTDAVEFVQGAGATVAATITAHHLLFNRNDMLVGGIRPHYYCLPILKRNIHQQALLQAAISGSPRFFLGHRLGAAHYR